MQGFTSRDYVVAGIIITGVLAGWFALMAGLVGVIDLRLAIILSVACGIIVYATAKRSQRK